MYHPFAFNKEGIRLTSGIDFLIVGGGGAGGFRTGGGGGAGGYITSLGTSGGGKAALPVFTASMYTEYQITVGGGGNSFNTDSPSTGNGSYSRFANYIAEGGGRGGTGYNGITDEAIYRNGQPGGSGGGGGSWQYSSNYASGSGGTGSAYYGFAYGYSGGSGSIASNGSFRRGGGGGGADSAGGDAGIGTFATIGANGGNGLITNGISSIYRAGGGGGGATTIGGVPITGSGGLGGGGRGATANFSAGSGTELTGGGGGGGYTSIGGSGGAGVIILKYNASEITASLSIGATASEQQDGNYKLLTITEAAPGDTIQFDPII